MQERIQLFVQKNKAPPKRILVYRDGVSEGQFKIIRDEELPAIRQSFRKFDTAQGPYNPSVTIVVCVRAS